MRSFSAIMLNQELVHYYSYSILTIIYTGNYVIICEFLAEGGLIYSAAAVIAPEPHFCLRHPFTKRVSKRVNRTAIQPKYIIKPVKTQILNRNADNRLGLA